MACRMTIWLGLGFLTTYSYSQRPQRKPSWERAQGNGVIRASGDAEGATRPETLRQKDQDRGLALESGRKIRPTEGER